MRAARCSASLRRRAHAGGGLRRRRGAPAGHRALAGRPTEAAWPDERPARSWSSSTRRSFARLPGHRRRCTGPRWPSRAATTSTAPSAHARQALRLAAAGRPPHPAQRRGAAGLAAWATGDLDAAHDGVRRVRRRAPPGRARRRRARLLLTLADIQLTQGRLGDAMRDVRAGARARDRGARRAGAAGDRRHARRAEPSVLCERDDLAAAAEHLPASHELGEHAGLPQNPYRWRVAMARLRAGRGRPRRALDLLDEAERVYVGDFSPNVRPVPAVRARVLAAARRARRRAVAWARERQLSADDELSLPARVRARHPRPAAPRQARGRARDDLPRGGDQPPGAAPRRGRGGRADRRRVIEVLVLQALAQQARGDTAAALAPLERAADPGRAGGPRPRLRRRGPADGGAAARRWRADGTADRLRSAGCWPPPRGRRPAPSRHAGAGRAAERARARRAPAARHATWTAPTSPASSSVSLNTMRTHTKNIYAKLGVTSRRGAVRRAAGARPAAREISHLAHHTW